MRNANPIGKLLVAPSSKTHGGKDIPNFVANRAKQTVPKYIEPADRTMRPRKEIPGVIILSYFRRQVMKRQVQIRVRLGRMNKSCGSQYEKLSDIKPCCKAFDFVHPLQVTDKIFITDMTVEISIPRVDFIPIDYTWRQLP